MNGLMERNGKMLINARKLGTAAERTMLWNWGKVGGTRNSKMQIGDFHC